MQAGESERARDAEGDAVTGAEGKIQAADNEKQHELISSLTAQITQLQGALAQAGTELSLAKVELSLLRSKGIPNEDDEVQLIIAHLKRDLHACQTELNILRRVQALEESPTDLTVLKAQISEEFTNAICLRVQRNIANDEPPKSLTQLNQELERKAKVITGLLADIEHLKVDLSFQQQRCDSLVEERSELQRQVTEIRKKHDALKDKLDEKEVSVKHSLIDNLAKFNEVQAATVIGSATRKAIENDEKEAENALLRNEVKTKDLALWLAHFENKKEKKRKEIAETKVAKMSDRLQKLMFICERHRKEIMDLKAQLDRLHTVKQAKQAPTIPGAHVPKTAGSPKRKVRPSESGSRPPPQPPPEVGPLGTSDTSLPELI